MVKRIAIPRRHTTTVRDIWQLQQRLPRRSGKRAFRLLELNKFRAGFDFLEMRGEIEGGETKQLAEWWATFQSAGRNMRQAMVGDIGNATAAANLALAAVNHPATNPRVNPANDACLHCDWQ